jgi:hypothetical protein
VSNEFKNEIFTMYDPHPAPACGHCGRKLSLVLKMLDPRSGNTVRMFKCGCGEQTWTEDKE